LCLQLLNSYLGEARKVSSYRATPGRQSPNNDKNTNTTKPQQSENSTHIPCGSQASVLEEAHGICAVALPASSITTT
jgi:hypothetical protein